ncbi:hypothetical protein HJG60_011428 [Phyllostomus discolor]|uniref:Uncharacterized protein n=1 Tax=Phyllostomus discolor TaxID=89673 RepID=A0A834E5I4_9CHIR|nr:hypothetical protein HJG60_011428 [Phyllostomus discolor]
MTPVPLLTSIQGPPRRAPWSWSSLPLGPVPCRAALGSWPGSELRVWAAFQATAGSLLSLSRRGTLNHAACLPCGPAEGLLPSLSLCCGPSPPTPRPPVPAWASSSEGRDASRPWGATVEQGAPHSPRHGQDSVFIASDPSPTLRLSQVIPRRLPVSWGLCLLSPLKAQILLCLSPARDPPAALPLF